MARKFLLPAAIFVIALTLRLMSAPQLRPLDDLYHWKRIGWSATHFPQVLEFDPDRGERGAFCPWPPLYDLGCAAIARLTGLSRILWIPPLVAAMCTAIAAFFIARNFGTIAGVAAGIALATSPFLVTESSIGDIDHHFVEWPLTFAILAAATLALRGHSGILLALSMSVAMFIQPALLIACGLAFIVLFSATDGKAAAIGFSATAVIIAIYRMTRGAGYPDNPWFLGWPQVALFAGAAVASAILFFRRRRPTALILGIATVFAFRSALPSILEGMHFFGGDPWLRTIVEFQPMWRQHADDVVSEVAGLSAGAVLVWILAAQAIRRRDWLRGAIALFAIIYLLLTISSRRFWSVGIPLLALAGAVCAASLADRRRAIFAATAVAVIPAVQLALWWTHKPAADPQQMMWIRTAEFLRTQARVGRVLAPWPLGHVLDVIGQRAVIIDNFGTMPDPIAFDRANEALLARDESALARYCDQTGVRFVVLDNPQYELPGAAASIGWDAEKVKRLARSTWWWRAYFNRGAIRRFHLIHADGLLVWELSTRVR
jgi:asparagine N-glycosylation enzyme membrane subunit Stt3